MEKKMLQKAKKVTLSLLSVFLIALVTLPVCAIITEIIRFIAMPIGISFATLMSVILIQAMVSVFLYKFGKKAFNYLKDEFIIGHKSLKRKMKNIIRAIDLLEKTDDKHKTEKVIASVDDLIEEERNILKKADETVELLAQLSENNVLELSFSNENKAQLVKDMVQLQNYKQVYKEKIKKFEDIKNEKRGISPDNVQNVKIICKNVKIEQDNEIEQDKNIEQDRKIKGKVIPERENERDISRNNNIS